MANAPRTAGLLIIGNEILSGKVQEENLRPLTQVLRSLGIRLAAAVIVEDEISTIAEELQRMKARHSLVFTSGGVGPTHDDVTVDAVAQAFERGVESHPALAELISQAYAAATTAAHLRMARVPAGATLVTAGDVRWPVIVVDNVWLLPGVPEIFRMKLAVLREHLLAGQPFVTRAVYVGLEESELKDWLDQVVAEHPRVQVGSYPKWFDTSYKTKITFDGLADDEVRAAFDAFLRLLPEGEPRRTE